MKRGVLLPLVGSLVLLLGSRLGWAGQYEEKERAELAQALKGAKVSLKQGIVASAPKGKPISGKFEVEDGKLQLSVYTAKGGAFSEVLVDPKSGRVAKVEAIEGGEDLTAAKAQADAIGQGQDTASDSNRCRRQEESRVSARQRDPCSEGGSSRRGREPHQG